MGRKKAKFTAVLVVARMSLSAWADSPRGAFVLLAMAMMCYGALRELRLAMLPMGYGIPWAEAPLFAFHRQSLLAGTLFLLLMTDLPKKGSAQNYQLIRTSRARWLSGQVTYCLLMVAVFVAVMIALSLLFAIPILQAGNTWSESAREQLGYALPAEASFPLATREAMPPARALLINIALSGAYWLGLALLILFSGLIGQSLFGLVPAMVIQLLPWMVNTFVQMEPIYWFPGSYATVFLPQYAQFPGRELVAIAVFLSVDLLLVGLMFWRLKRADLSFVSNQGGSMI